MSRSFRASDFCAKNFGTLAALLLLWVHATNGGVVMRVHSPCGSLGSHRCPKEVSLKNGAEVTFGGSALDRAAQLRGQPETLAALQPDALAMVFWRGKPLFHPGADVVLMPMAETPEPDHRLFLGLDETGVALFAVDISSWCPDGQETQTLGAFLDPSEQIHPELPGVFVELRAALPRLSPRMAELAATARGLFEWHRSHGFCANCGTASDSAMAGWQRDCVACGRHHFPRTDPVVIMLILAGNATLLGRSPGWPDGMYSCLAGFVEPGETVEAAVRREVFEEAGITVGQVEYLTSQPWPFPASLMIGCLGMAEDEAITIDPAEIEDAIWVNKEDLARAMDGRHETIKPVRKGSIAHFLLSNWLSDTLD